MDPFGKEKNKPNKNISTFISLRPVHLYSPISILLFQSNARYLFSKDLNMF